MNEQRTQAYLNLVNQLLSCNDGDKPRILQENQELLDQGLIEVMVAVAQQLGNAGRENGVVQRRVTLKTENYTRI
jgi:hypothetical protein